MQGGSISGSTPQTNTHISQNAGVLASGHSSIDRQLESLFRNISQLVVDESGTEKDGQKDAPEGAPPLQTPNSNLSVNDMMYLMGELSAETSNTAIQAEQQYNELLNKVAQQQAQNQIDQTNKAADQSTKSQHKSGIMKAFGWITSIASIVVGAALTIFSAGALAAVGVAMMVGGAMGIVMQTKLGSDIMKLAGDAINDICKFGQALLFIHPPKDLPPEVQNILAGIAVAVAMIAITIASGGVAAALLPEEGLLSLFSAGEATAETVTTTSSEVGTTASQTGEAAVEGGSAAASDSSSFTNAFCDSMSRLAQWAREMNVTKAIAWEQLIVGLANVALQTNAAVGAYQAQMAESDAIAAKAAFTNTENFIKMANNTLTDMLKTLQSSISAAVQTLGQSASVTANIMGSA